MSVITSFPPIADHSVQVLILGSMPGVLSLKANQYYAHPRNAFWVIMGNLYNFDAYCSYESRVNNLKKSHVALWDVLHSCVRPGSLDSSIKNDSRICNDFKSFFSQYTNIRLIAFNGTEAEKSFNKYVLPGLNLFNLRFIRLPSSSPAHTKTLEYKIEAWRKALLIANTKYKS